MFGTRLSLYNLTNDDLYFFVMQYKLVMYCLQSGWESYDFRVNTFEIAYTIFWEQDNDIPEEKEDEHKTKQTICLLSFWLLKIQIKFFKLICVFEYIQIPI